MKEIIQEDVYLGHADFGQKGPPICAAPYGSQEIEQRKKKFSEKKCMSRFCCIGPITVSQIA